MKNIPWTDNIVIATITVLGGLALGLSIGLLPAILFMVTLSLSYFIESIPEAS